VFSVKQRVMSRVKIKDLTSRRGLSRSLSSARTKTNNSSPADVTLINLNLMLTNHSGHFDQQNYIPLGLLYIASFLEREGYNVEFIDYQLFSQAKAFDVELFIQEIGETAKLVGMSCMSNLLPFTILCAKELKKVRPDCRVVLGGVGPSPVGREIIKEFPFIDSVVEGEGELPMLDFLKGKIIPFQPRRIVKDLDSLPLPAYSLLNIDFYDAKPSIVTSRGCPYRCSFCTEPHNFGGRIRYRSIESVVDELELVHSLSGQTMFLFQDDILTLHRKRFETLLQAFHNLSFPIQWKCFSRVDLMDEKLMEGMATSGCVQIKYGVESGSNGTLDRINKGFSIEQAYRTAKKSVDYFPSVHASFIWGYPFESTADVEATLCWASRFEDAGVSVLLFEFSPLPGSDLYKQFERGLKLNKESYSFYVITGHEVIDSSGYKIRPELNPIYQLIEKYPRIFSGFYQYENMAGFRRRKMAEHYKIGRRTPLRNIYDL
jgi:anaerobic magnesium-protoporphyrin IX monomethyl ester cyclase